MTDKSLKEIFVGARELLSDETKWGRDQYFNGNCYCLIGACGVGAGLSNMEIRSTNAIGDIEKRVRPALERCLPKGPVRPRPAGPVIAFNDDPGTTHADILAVLDCAIKCCVEPAS